VDPPVAEPAARTPWHDRTRQADRDGHGARGTDAQHVFVNGEQLLDNGRFTRVDDLHITDLLRRASDRAKALGRRAGLLPRD
jgi:hypothetical protein